MFGRRLGADPRKRLATIAGAMRLPSSVSEGQAERSVTVLRATWGMMKDEL